MPPSTEPHAPASPFDERFHAVELHQESDQDSGNEPPRLNSVERWLIQNVVPLIVICVALSVTIISETVMAFHGNYGSSETDKDEESVPFPALDKLQDNPIVRLRESAPLAGFLTCIAIGTLSLASREHRERLGRLLKPLPRYVPALHAMDLLAVFFVFMAAASFITLMLNNHVPRDSGGRMALELLVMAAVEFVAVVTSIALARHRGCGKVGSIGLWPFWQPLGNAGPKIILRDVGLGLVAYPLSIWIVDISGAINAELVEKLGKKTTEHPLVPALLHHPSNVTLAIFITMATLGAAFFEELIFRGVLYNVLARYFGKIPGAIFAGLLFALAHKNESQFLALFVLALVLTWLYERTGRLVAGMTLHATFNAITVLLVLSISGK